MAELKTKETKASVASFLAGVEDPEKRADCRKIAKLMREATGKRAKMWGSSIVGYGRYDYTYKSGRSGTWMLTGFSPRARNITIYIMPGFKKFGPLLKKLGKYKTARSCLYIKRLDDIDEAVLARLVADSVREMQRIYGAS
jgi:hypothetical protein